MSEEHKKKQGLIIPHALESDEDEGGGLGGFLFESDSDEGEGGRDSGGKTGEIAKRYKDILSTPKRDDLLPPSEIKRLLSVHYETHKDRVTKQKITREQRAALKEGRYVAPQSRAGLGSGRHSPYKRHPISDKAQFSGIDKQVVGVPTLNEADTNNDLKDALENRLENKLQNRLQNRPTSTPKFRPY